MNPRRIGVVGDAAALVLAGDHLFYTAIPDGRDGSIDGLPSYVSKIPVSGGTPTNLVTTVKGGVALSPVRVDDENVYFFSFDTRISKVPRSGGTPTTLARLDSTLPIGGVDFDVDATSVYFFEGAVI